MAELEKGTQRRWKPADSEDINRGRVRIGLPATAAAIEYLWEVLAGTGIRAEVAGGIQESGGGVRFQVELDVPPLVEVKPDSES